VSTESGQAQSAFGEDAWVKTVAKKPIWIIYGEGDAFFPGDKMHAYVKALKDAGGSPHYVEYQGTGHSSATWSRGYKDPMMAEWLFSQSLVASNSDAGVTVAVLDAGVSSGDAGAGGSNSKLDAAAPGKGPAPDSSASPMADDTKSSPAETETGRPNSESTKSSGCSMGGADRPAVVLCVFAMLCLLPFRRRQNS
jgi:hypothetical protein